MKFASWQALTISSVESRLMAQRDRRYFFLVALWLALAPICPSRGALAVAEEAASYKLWSGSPLGDVGQLAAPDGIEHHVIYRAVAGEHQFLHGVALAHHRGLLHACWANSPVDENSEDETLRGAVSSDGGVTWTTPHTIGAGFDGPLRHSHGVYLTDDNGALWCFGAKYGLGPGRFPGLQTEAWRLDDESGEWSSRGIAIENARPVDAPQRLPTGNWIMGVFDRESRPGVAISSGDDLLHWSTVALVGDCDGFGDTTALQLPDRLLAIVRSAPIAVVAESLDWGRTWTPLIPSNFPMAPSKAFAGRLSTGQWYLIANVKNRDHLVIAVSRRGEPTLSQAWIVRQGKSEAPRFPGRAKGSQWSYPYACEHQGKLFVGYSIGKEDAGLSVIPVKSLEI